MEMKKKKSLVKNVTFSIIILSILFILSIINFQLFNNIHDKQHHQSEQFNNIDMLLNEFLSVSKESHRLSNLYTSTYNQYYLEEYNRIFDVYKGNAVRNNDSYFLYSNEIKPFSDLIKIEVKKYNSDFMDEVDLLLTEFDKILLSQKFKIEVAKANQGSNEVRKNEIQGTSYNTELISLNLNIEKLKSELYDYQADMEKSLSQQYQILHISWYTVNTLIVFYGFYFVLKMYILVIKPIKDGHALIEEINKGNDNIRLNYPHNNELTDVVDKFNKYIDISQNSLKLIIDQYNKLKLYSDIGEINYFEYDFDKREVKVSYSKKFVEKYYLSSNEVTYTFKEYMTLIYKDDLKRLVHQLHKTHKESKDYRFDFRIKFPGCKDFCYVTTVGQRNKNLFIGVQTDITDLKLTQKLLQEQEEQYRLILENTTDLIAKIKPDGEIIYASQSYRDVFKKELNSDFGKYTNDYDNTLKITNTNWIDNVLTPPYSSQEKILLSTSQGEKWIHWNNDAVFNENNEIDYIISVGHDITTIQQTQDRYQYESEHDLLTKLLNRRGLFNTIANLKDLTTLTAFFIDVNNFKNINDFYGHEIGDKVIVKISEDLIGFEEMGCIIGRLSGDEFIILVPNATSLNFIQNRIRRIASKNYQIDNNDIFISASIGYAIYPDDTDDLNKIISYADMAMYEAKITRNRNCLRFTQNMYEVVNNKVKMASDLKKALDFDEFEVYFQPIVNHEVDDIEYLEALVRWNSPKGIISPGVFLPIAEESGFMQSLDLLIIRKALANFYIYKRKKGKQLSKLSINVSPIMLLQEDFPLRLSNLVRKQKLKNEEICIEISENTFVNNIEHSSIQIIKLRKLGFLVALDDFGREYSSLSILDNLEFDLIKIDRLFISNLSFETNIEIINMIIKIAHLKKKQVIAEGVETVEQKEKLIKLGCYLMQGFLFAKPQRMEDGILITEKEMS